MKIQEAIEKAIESGWRPNQLGRVFKCEYGTAIISDNFCTDPLFWQALGKKLWSADMWHEDDGEVYWDFYIHCSECGSEIIDEGGCERECLTENGYVISWLHYWHKFIDHLADGGTIESFFETL